MFNKTIIIFSTPKNIYFLFMLLKYYVYINSKVNVIQI